MIPTNTLVCTDISSADRFIALSTEPAAITVSTHCFLEFSNSPCRGLQILPNSKALSGLGIALAAHFSEAGSSYRILLWLLGVQKVTEVIG